MFFNFGLLVINIDFLDVLRLKIFNEKLIVEFFVLLVCLVDSWKLFLYFYVEMLSLGE